MSDEDVEKVWAEFWWRTINGAVEDETGKRYGLMIDESGTYDVPALIVPMPIWLQIKRELFDWHTVIDVVPAVYSHATGGAMSKPNYNSVSQITGCIDEHYDEIAKDNIVDMLLDLDSVFRKDAASDPEGEAAVLLQDATEYVLQCFDISPDDLVDAGKRRDRLRHEAQKRADGGSGS